MKKAQDIPVPVGYNYVKNIIKTEYIYSAFETDYGENFYFRGEFHPFWELVYVLSGSVAASGDDRVYYLDEGDIIFHKPMEFHRLWAVDNIKPHLFIMSFHLEGAYASELENGVYALNVEQKDKILDVLSYLKKNSLYDDNNKERCVTYFLNNWQNPVVSQNVANRLEGFLLSMLGNKGLLKKEDSREEIKIYKKIISILSENIYRQISLDEIARQCNMSKSQIKKNFAANSYIGIHKYFIKLKIAESMKLMSQGHAINEISDMLDFATPNYFSTAFKRETGMSPLEYKNKRGYRI